MIGASAGAVSVQCDQLNCLLTCYGVLCDIRKQSCRDMSRKLGARLWVRTSNFEHPVDSVSRLVQQHPFNRKLQLLLPVPDRRQATTQVPDLSAFYYGVHTTLGILTDAKFIPDVLTDATFLGVCLDRSQRAAITPDAHLHLVVLKSHYQRLGITGKRLGATGRLLQSSCRHREWT